MPGSDLLNSTSPVALNTYTPQNFMDVKKREMFGPRTSRREQRKFNKYLFSPQGMQDAVAFDRAEKLKAQAASDYVTSRNAPVLKASMPPIVSDEQKQATLNAITQPTKAPTPKPEQKTVNTAYWNSQANKFGFNNMDEVKAWQQQNGLVADGMFGKNSEAKWKALQQPAQLVSRTITTADGTPMDVVRKGAVSETPVSTSRPMMTEEQFRKHANFRNIYGLPYNHTVTIEGKKYPVMASTGLYNNTMGIENDAIYAFDPATGQIRQVAESMVGTPKSEWASGSDWSNALSGLEAQKAWMEANPAPARRGPLGGGYTQEYNDWFKKYQAARAGWKKQGGIMNRINYFQQGGAAPQQDIKAQVTALVQAAMQGDQKATQQVNQIMEAAKTGDQQAMQIAQIMEQVIKELQGQATAAKWGAKLEYIKSLKYAKGGKTCPACEKKVEMKACGGKKAPKKQEGGWMELLPIYGTVQSGKRFFKNPSWKSAGEFGLDLLGDVTLLTGVGGGAGAALKAAKVAKATGAVAKTAKTRNAYKAAKAIAKTHPGALVEDAAAAAKITPLNSAMYNLTTQAVEGPILGVLSNASTEGLKRVVRDLR